MAALEPGEVAQFPFVDPPDRRHIKDGVDLLREWARWICRPAYALGRQLAQLPVDPRLGRMVLAAGTKVAWPSAVIASALSIQDPRERPADAQEAADTMHGRFAEPDSDYLSYLNLWRYLRDRQRELSGSQFRKLCRSEFLNYLRVREWQDLEAQLRQAAAGLGIGRGTGPAGTERIHTALLAGLLSHVGLYDSEKRGTSAPRRPVRHQSRFGAVRKSPHWVMAAELVETTRLWGRVVARIDPAWVEPWPGTWSSAATASRTGTARGGSWRMSGSRSTAFRSWPPAGSAMAGSTRCCPASCSSGTRWSRVTGRPTTRSSSGTWN
jgi:ATP-dependent helicase HrpA